MLFRSYINEDDVFNLNQYGRLSTLEFNADVQPSDIRAIHYYSDLVLLIKGTNDSITLSNYFYLVPKSWFYQGEPYPYSVNQIRFADGTVWTMDTMRQLVMQGQESADLLTGFDSHDVLNGLGGNDTLDGGNGDDTLNGGAGDDLLTGGFGSDSYVFGRGLGQDTISDFDFSANRIDAVTFLADVLPSEVSVSNVNGNLKLSINGTNDAITVNYFFGVVQVNGKNIVMLDQVRFANGTVWDVAKINALIPVTFTGTSASEAINGRDGADSLNGGGGNDTIDGGLGVDTLIGGLGDDVFWVDESNDKIIENANQGLDSVNSSVTYSLNAHVENLTLTSSAAIDGTGNELANQLTGNAAANRLEGAAGNDTLIGHAGNDTLDGSLGADSLLGGSGDDVYVIDDAGDAVIENTNEGLDSVNSSVTYSLSAHVENLTLTGSAAINATGNALNNVITGNTANNRLNGGDGNDTMDGGLGLDSLIGGLGDDVYVVNQSGVVISESANQGLDTVWSSVAWTLASNLENLTLTGTAAISGKGNALNNLIIGNSAGNTLNGDAGADTLIGGFGDDLYLIDTLDDVVIENAGEGNDAVKCSISYTLGANVEQLILLGGAAINATGNELANRLTGNSADNVLIGGVGMDTLSGGGGSDTFWFNVVASPGNRDTITDFVSGVDKLQFSVSALTALGATGQWSVNDARFWSSTTGLAHDADDRLIFNTTNRTLAYDSDGNGAGGAVVIETLIGVASLAATDIWVV